MKNNRVFTLIIVVLGSVVALLGYQIYELNNSILLLKSEFNSKSIDNNENKQTQDRHAIESNNVLDNNTNLYKGSWILPDNYFSTTLTQASAQSTEQSGAGGGSNGGGGGGGGGGGSENTPENLITKALFPDPSSLLLVIIRTAIIAALVFVIVKWLGGKGIGQLSPFGLLIVVGLGSAIGDPMIYNEISIPQAMVAVIIAVIFFKVIDYLTLKSKRFRESIEPKPILLVDYGELNKDGLNKAKLDMEEFEIEMRLAGIETVGEIKFARLEPNGRISFILRKSDKNKI